MKTNWSKLFLLAFLCFIPNFVDAASSCSYSEQAELNEIVSHVNANYEVVDIYLGKTLDIDNQDDSGNIPEIDNYTKGFKIAILNITEDIYIKVSNDYNDEVKTFRYTDTQDGTASFQTDKVDKLVNYTIEVYSNKYSCAGEMFRKFTLVTPMYNNYSQFASCKENPDFYYCQEFISSENITLDAFIERLKEFKEEKENKEQQEMKEGQSFIDKLKEFYKNNAIVINSIGVAIVVVGVVATVVLVKKKRSRVL